LPQRLGRIGGVSRLGGLQPSNRLLPALAALGCVRGYFYPSDEVLAVKGLFAGLVVIVLVVAALGFYQGWFKLSTNNTENKSNVTLSVDKDKLRADEEKVKDKVRDLGQKAKEKTRSGSD
jgi:hypothetical protein